MIERLFVYGSLRDAPVQQKLLNTTLDGTPATVYGYHRHTEFGIYPVALPAVDTNRIEGVVLEVTSEQLARLDEYEGDGYIRITVALADESTAWIYIGNPDVYP